MDKYIRVVLVSILATAVAQKYTQIDISADLIAVQQRISTESELIFETKLCNNEGGISFHKSKSSNWDYSLKLSKTINSTKPVHFWRYPLHESRAQGIITNVDCTGYRKFKFTMSDRNMSLWMAQASGWEHLLSWTDSAPLTTVFSHIRIYTKHAGWKIYQIEHTTEPYKTDCIKF